MGRRPQKPSLPPWRLKQKEISDPDYIEAMKELNEMLGHPDELPIRPKGHYIVS